MSNAEQATPALQQLAELVDGQRVVMIATAAADGRLSTRPMTLLEFDDQGRFWFFCDHDPADHATALRHAQVNLAFSDEGDSTYVSVCGRGALVHDPVRNEQLWTQAAKPWFPDGPTSPRLALLCVTPDQAEYWDAPDSKAVRAIAMIASVLVAKPVGMGEHGVLDTAR